MTEQMLIVLFILAGAIALWSWGRPRDDIVAVLIVVALILSRVLTPQESLAGFGDPIVILIAAVFVVGAALESTGIVHRLSLALLKLGRGSETRLIVLIMLLVGGITAFMSSTAATAMFIPVILAITAQTGLNRKRMLMPLAVAATIGGMMTLISSLPNMIVVNVLTARGLPPLNFFSVTPFGLSVLVAGIVYMLFARGLLSRQQTVEVAKTKAPRAGDLLDYYGLTSWWHRLQLSASSPLIGRSVTQLRSLYDQFGVIPVGLEKNEKGKTRFMPALPETVFETGDAVFVTVPADQAQQLVETQKLTELPRLEPAQSREALQELGVAELMLAPESKLIAKTVSETDFRSQYQVSVLAVRHRGETLTANLAQHRLDFGDTLLIAGGWDQISRLRDQREDFAVLTLSAEYQERLPARRRAPMAIAILVLMVVAMASGLVHLTAAALLAALAMLATRCVGGRHLSRHKLEDISAGRWDDAAGDGAEQDGYHGDNRPRNGESIRLGGAHSHADRLVPSHRSGRTISIKRRDDPVNRPGGCRGSPSITRFTYRLCNDGRDFLLRLVCHSRLVHVEFAGHGPGRLLVLDYVKVGLPLLFLTMLITVTLVKLIYHF